MYRQNLNKLDNITATLMQTPKKPLCELPVEYIDNIVLNWDDVHTMSLTIPSIININGVRKENIIYNKIKGKSQQIIISNPDIRFYIDTMSIKEEKVSGTDIIFKTKTITCKSFENTISEKLILNEDTLYELYNDDGTGILNEFETYNKGWKVRYVSDNAKYETGIIRKETTISIGNNKTYDGARDILLWNYNTPINAYSDKTYVDFKVKYKNVVTTYNGTVQSDLNFTHTSDELHTGIKSIEAYYCKYEGDYCVKYIVKLADDIEKTFYETFCFIDNMQLTIGSIDLIYCTGEEVEDTYTRKRNIEQGEYKWLDILRSTLSNGYDGLYVEFDTINKEISVFNRSEYGSHHGIQFSYKNYVQAINKNIVGDDIVSKVRVTSNDYSISEVNKFGGEYIYDYSYAYNNDIMSDELKEAWDKYIEFVNTNEGSLVNYREERSSYNKELVKLESEKVAIDYDIQNLQTLQSVLFSQQTESGVDMSAEIESYYNKIQERQTRFAEVMSSISVLNDKIALLNSNLNSLQEKYSFETCGLFDDDLLDELYSLTIYEEISDDSFTSAKELYENYLYLIYIRNNQGVEFNIDSVGFIENLIVPKGLTWNYYLELGSFVDLENAEGIDVEERGVRIIGYTIDLKNKTITDITLTNRDRKVNELSGVFSIRDMAKRSNAFVNNNKSTWSQSKISNKDISSLMSGIDLSKIGVRSNGEGVSIIQNKAGIFVTDNNNYNISAYSRSVPEEIITTAEDENGNENQIYIGRSLICISDDNFKTCKTAITGNSITADLLKGKVILGEKLIVDSENGSLKIGNIDTINDTPTTRFGLKVSDIGGVDRVFLGVDYEDNKAKLEMYNSDGEDVIFSDNGRISEFNDSKWSVIDENVPVYHYLRLRGNVERVEEVILTIKPQAFRVFSKGMESAGGGNISLTGTNASINIEGKETDLVKDKRQTLLKPTGVKKDITEITELEEYKFCLDATTNELASIYLPSIEKAENSEVIDNLVYSYDTDSHKHGLDLQLDNVSLSGNIEINGHVHNEIYGVFIQEDALPSDMSIYINGQLVSEHLNDSFELNITQYIPTVEGLHEIMITSATRGCVDVNLYCRSFSKWG